MSENLVQKLANIRKMSCAVKKDKKGYNYSYSDITEILAKVTSGMQKYGVSLIPSIKPGTARVTKLDYKSTKTDRSGRSYENISTEMLVEADMMFTWINDENPEEKIEVPWIVTGSQQDPSQAFGSGLTYCTRYFLCNYFQIAQTDMDVDAYRSKQKEAEKEEEKAILLEIVDSIDSSVREFLGKNPDKAGEIRDFFSKYVKNGNYKSIKDVAVASSLLNDFNNTYNKEED